MQIEILGIAGVASITLICFGVAFALKKTGKFPTKYIPLLCMALGLVLGLVGYFVIPGFPATDWLSALAVGIASGWAATGAHQSVKQLYDAAEEKKMNGDDDDASL
ncbi:MAG: phage holin family protein [Clostridia bacterium]|nr:phage holin family protein [Clostridia bacterium]